MKEIPAGSEAPLAQGEVREKEGYLTIEEARESNVLGRVRAEKADLEMKLAKLRRFLAEPVGASVRGVQLLKDQRDVMEKYNSILSERIGDLMNQPGSSEEEKYGEGENGGGA